MTMKKLYFLLFIVSTAVATSCMKDSINLENVSTDKFSHDGGFRFPGVQGSFGTDQIFDDLENDSSFKVYDDSIVITSRRDSAFVFGIADFQNSEASVSNIINGFALPSKNLTYSNPSTGPLPQDTFISNVSSVNFKPIFAISENADVDSIVLNSGEIIINANSVFEPDIYLVYQSNDIIKDGNKLHDSVLVSGTVTHSIPLDDATIVLQKNFGPPDSVFFNIDFSFSIDAKAGESIINGNNVSIEVSSDNFEDYQYIFGYFGNFNVKEFNELDTFSFRLPNAMSKLEGNFKMGSPRINFYTRNSFGIPMQFNIGIRANLNNGTTDSAMFQPALKIRKPEDYISQDIIEYKSVADGKPLNRILGDLPPPDLFSAAGDIRINPNGDILSYGYINAIKPQSLLSIDLEIEIPLDFGANLTYRDTFPAEDLFDLPKFLQGIEYARLHYRFSNGFPLGLDVKMVLWDTINNVMVDTIKFNENSEFFLEGAAVDENGMVQEIIQKEDFIEINHEKIENLFNLDGNLILVINLVTTDEQTTTVKLQDDNKLHYTLAGEIKFNVDNAKF